MPTRASMRVNFPCFSPASSSRKVPQSVPRRRPRKCPRKCPRKVPTVRVVSFHMFCFRGVAATPLLHIRTPKRSSDRGIATPWSATGGGRMCEIGVFWQIGVLTGKPCTFLVQNGLFSASCHYKDKERLSRGLDEK